MYARTPAHPIPEAPTLAAMWGDDSPWNDRPLPAGADHGQVRESVGWSITKTGLQLAYVVAVVAFVQGWEPSPLIGLGYIGAGLLLIMSMAVADRDRFRAQVRIPTAIARSVAPVNAAPRGVEGDVSRAPLVHAPVAMAPIRLHVT